MNVSKLVVTLVLVSVMWASWTSLSSTTSQAAGKIESRGAQIEQALKDAGAAEGAN